MILGSVHFGLNDAKYVLGLHDESWEEDHIISEVDGQSAWKFLKFDFELKLVDSIAGKFTTYFRYANDEGFYSLVFDFLRDKLEFQKIFIKNNNNITEVSMPAEIVFGSWIKLRIYILNGTFRLYTVDQITNEDDVLLIEAYDVGLLTGAIGFGQIRTKYRIKNIYIIHHGY